MDCVLDLTYLTEQERHWIAEVLNRDDEIQKKEDARVIRLKNKAARTNNPIIQKKIKMRTGEWFIELAEKQGSLKRIGSVNATVRASLRMKRKSKGKAVKASSPPVIEEIEAEPIRQDAESIDMQSHQEEVDATSSYPKHISSDRFDISGVGESYSSVDNEDKVEELSNALNFLQNVENDSDDKPDIQHQELIARLKSSNFRTSVVSGRKTEIQISEILNENEALTKVLKMLTEKNVNAYAAFKHLDSNKTSLLSMTQSNKQYAKKHEDANMLQMQSYHKCDIDIKGIISALVSENTEVTKPIKQQAILKPQIITDHLIASIVAHEIRGVSGVKYC